MAVLGWIFLVLIGVGVLTGLALFVMSLPDLRRYFAIKRM